MGIINESSSAIFKKILASKVRIFFVTSKIFWQGNYICRTFDQTQIQTNCLCMFATLFSLKWLNWFISRYKFDYKFVLSFSLWNLLFNSFCYLVFYLRIMSFSCETFQSTLFATKNAVAVANLIIYTNNAMYIDKSICIHCNLQRWTICKSLNRLTHT